MRSVQRAVTIILAAAVLSGCLPRGGPSPAADARSAAGQEAPGYPAPVITPPSSPEGWPTPVPPTPTVTPEPYIQTAEAIMALPTWTPLPTATATLEPTPVATLGPEWSVMLLSGVLPLRGEPAIVRLQVDGEGRPVAGPQALDVSYLNTPWCRIGGMVPSADGRRVLVHWTYGDADWGASVLDVITGILGPGLLPDEEASIEAWHPDGERVLAQTYFGGTPREPFLLNVDTGERQPLPIPRDELRTWEVSGGAFSPDGSEVVVAYTVSGGRPTRSEVWRCTLEGSCDMLFETDTDLVDYVSWSPRGDWIAVRQYTPPSPDKPEWDRVGELWLASVPGAERVDLGAALVAGGGALAPKWSRSGDQLAYLRGQQVPGVERLALHTGIAVWNAQLREVHIFLEEGGRYVRSLSWAPDDVSLSYLEAPSDTDAEFALFRVSLATMQMQEVVPADSLSPRLGADSGALWLTHEEAP